MKQKTESKLTTLARLVAVYNDLVKSYNVNVRLLVLYDDRVWLRSDSAYDTKRKIEYTGDVSGAISAVAVALCRVFDLPSVHLNIMF